MNAPKTNRIFLRIMIVVVLLILSLGQALGGVQESPQTPIPGSPDPIEIRSGWQYRWGDSPMDDSGLLSWIAEPSTSSGWEDIRSLSETPQKNRDNFLWYRVRLPEGNWEHPTLFLPAILNSFEIYLEDALIYTFGDLNPSVGNKFSIVASHMVPLNLPYQNKMLSLRIYSSNSNFIGIVDVNNAVSIGNHGDLIGIRIRRNIDSVILGSLFIFIGLFSVFVFIRRFQQKAFFSLSFGAFSVFIGLFYVFLNPISAYLIDSPNVRYYLGLVAYFLFPVCLYIFLENVIGTGKAIRRIWQLHLAWALVAIILDLLNVFPLHITQFYYNMFFIATILIMFYIGFRAALSGNLEARIFVAAFLLFGLFGLYDLLAGLRMIPHWHWLSQWGTLLFIVSLGYIVERRFSENHRQLEIYSGELEAKSKELKQYSHTLERKVKERTKDLDQKNRELLNTLAELKETQHQLVMREKMASLGNLVAGVAHEVNNPIGAVNSAADVSARCIGRIKAAVEKDDTAKNVKSDSNFQKAFRLLIDNNRVIVNASKRIANIVKSLRNFARLDEAELQKADIHEGLDSTLTLVHHELKNKVEVIKEYGDVPPINCYPNQLNQVFMNLFVNAAHAIEEKGMIKIKTFAADQRVTIEISDTGKGIPKEAINEIFNPGFTTKGVGVGTGLGLSISYNIIRNHTGTIKVESAVGEGTTFTIKLPIT